MIVARSKEFTPYLRMWWLSIILILTGPANYSKAEASAQISCKEAEVWRGERLKFFIELRADGVFSGAASFDIPEIPNTIVTRVGNPVIGSYTENGTEFFTQLHEFALFTQTDGPLEIPPITARFSHKKGYTGDDFEVSHQTRTHSINVKRPPGSEGLGFVVTTDSLIITETWEPEQTEPKIGSVLKRTITQHAVDVTGMALCPFPADAPAGIRVYTEQAEITDKTDRGEFTGSRVDTVTYLVQEPGHYTLPVIRYDWWNPKSQTLESIILEPVSFSISAPPSETKSRPYIWWITAIPVLTIIFIYHRRVILIATTGYDRVYPKHKRIAHKLISACKRNDLEVAARLWPVVLTSIPNLEMTSELDIEARRLMARIYGSTSNEQIWNGKNFAKQFKLAYKNINNAPIGSRLPPLNS